MDLELNLGQVADQFASTPTTAPLARDQLARALWVVASLTFVVDLSAGFYQPAPGPVFGSHRVAYYCILVAILAVAIVEMTTAYFLSLSGGHGRRLLAFGKCLLCFAAVLLLVAVAVGGFALQLAAKA